MNYDIKKMKAELAENIEEFLKGNISEEKLKLYAWEQNNKWEQIDDISLPPHGDDDRIYWSAIWDIINFNDSPPEYHPTIEDLKMHLKSLRGEFKLPQNQMAFRPCRGVEKSKAYKEWDQKQPKDKLRRLP
jgi:hypothetical protein